MGLIDTSKDILGKLDKKFDPVAGTIGFSVKSAVDNIGNVEEKKLPSHSDIVEIGAPFKYNMNVDYNNRTQKFLKSKMSIIDLYPCHYGMSFGKIKEGVDTGSMEGTAAGFVPLIDYETAMNEYSNMCVDYEIPQTKAVRLFLTDETTVTDQISNNFTDSKFQSFLDTFRARMQSIAQLGRSLSSKYDETIDSRTEAAISKLKSYAKGKPTANNILDFVEKGVQFMMKGHKVSLPKIWNESNYSPQFAATIKLVSPYGSPASIQKWIIRPLLYLLLLSSPKTQDGVGFGSPFVVSIKGYGMTKINLATISSLTLNRGGSDSSFNIYKQPLTIDVSVSFDPLIEGIAAYSDNISNFEMNQYQLSREIKNDTKQMPNGVTGTTDGISNKALLTTVGDLVDAMRPVQFFSDHDIKEGGLRGTHPIGKHYAPKGGSVASSSLGGMTGADMLGAAVKFSTKAAKGQATLGDAMDIIPIETACKTKDDITKTTKSHVINSRDQARTTNTAISST